MSKRDELVFVILKPDCVARNIQDAVLAAISGIGLRIETTITVILNDDALKVIYLEILNEHFYKDLRDFMVSGPSMVVLARGTDAIARMNNLKHQIREIHRDGWVDLTESDVALFLSGNHPDQKFLNFKLVAANLLHVSDSESESVECAQAILDSYGSA